MIISSSIHSPERKKKQIHSILGVTLYLKKDSIKEDKNTNFKEVPSMLLKYFEICELLNFAVNDSFQNTCIYLTERWS